MALLVSEAALFITIQIKEKTYLNNLQLISSANWAPLTWRKMR